MKQEIKKTLNQGDCEVEELYDDTGWAQTLAKNDTFKNLTFFVIFLSSVWIAVDTDLNKPDASDSMKNLFFYMDNFICTYFFVEISVRFLAFTRKGDAFQFGSFNFDLVLVSLMCIDTWFVPMLMLITGGHASGSSGMASFRVLRLLRIVRIARLGRLVKACPDLMVLVRGMMMAMRAVFSTLLLLVIIIYIFAILFTQTMSGTEAFAGCFDNVPMSMNCLLLDGVFADQADFITKMLETDWLYYAAIVVYLFLTCLTVLNMLIGLVCEVISQAAQAESEERVLVGVRNKVREIMGKLDENMDDKVSRDEFVNMLQIPDVVRLLDEVEVDVCALVECGEFIFHYRQELTFDEFMEEIVKFRGGNPSTVKDTVDMRLFFLREMKKMEERIKDLMIAGPPDALKR
jgi:hypothetical protein